MTNHYSNIAAATTLSGAISDSAATITVSATTGFPSVPFTVALDYDTGLEELVSVTTVSGTTLTVVRGYDSTAAVAHDSGAVVRHVFSAKDFKDSRDHEASTAAHGATGAVMGTTNVQAVTNKDFSSSSNTFPTNILTTSSSHTVINKDLTSGTNTFPSSLTTDTELAASAATAAANLATHAATTATHGATGAVVGTTNTQTLTNKTLTSPTITTPTITSPTVTGVGERAFVLKTVNETLSGSTTLQDDDALTYAIGAVGTYVIDVDLAYTSTGTDVKAGLNFTAAGTLYTVGSGPGAISTSNNGTTPGILYETYSADSGNRSIRQTFVLVATATGTAKVQWAQSTSSPSAVTVLRGSWIRVRREA